MYQWPFVWVYTFMGMMRDKFSWDQHEVYGGGTPLSSSKPRCQQMEVRLWRTTCLFRWCGICIYDHFCPCNKIITMLFLSNVIILQSNTCVYAWVLTYKENKQYAFILGWSKVRIKDVKSTHIFKHLGQVLQFFQLSGMWPVYRGLSWMSAPTKHYPHSHPEKT